jgi:purine-binding chemotaxis protein CheW
MLSANDSPKKILRDRAALLARAPEDEDTLKERIEVVEFLLAHERYGLVSEHVREIHPLKDFTPVPCTPPFILGLVNVRGQILTVIDLRKFFELPGKGITNLNKVIILHTPEMELGILADEILGMRRIALDALQSSLPTLIGIRAEYLRGVVLDPDGSRMVVLDAARILSDKRIIVEETTEP